MGCERVGATPEEVDEIKLLEMEAKIKKEEEERAEQERQEEEEAELRRKRHNEWVRLTVTWAINLCLTLKIGAIYLRLSLKIAGKLDRESSRRTS